MDCDAASRLVSELFDSLYGICVRYAFRVTGFLDLSEDITQKAFMMLYSKVRQGETIDNPRGWLFCVIRREVIRHNQWQERHGEPFEQFTGIEARTDPADLPRSADDELGRLIEVLTRRELEVIFLRLESMKYQEIASQLGISTNSVKTLLTRALRKLQKAAKGKSIGERFSLHDREKLGRTLQ